MSDNRAQAIAKAHELEQQFLNELIELVRIPSVSTDPAHKPDMQRAAEWVAEKLKAIGMEHVAIMPTAKHPVVYADFLKAGDDKPTVLVYGHYDVQPSDPLDLWETQPFDPVVKDGKLYGRGASDMKGQVMASLHAIDMVMQHGGLPVNVKFLIEGEEEIGSPNLGAFIKEHTELLSADVALNPDGGILGAELPSLTYALRGLAYFEIRLQGPDHDLHSGIYGGTVINPANELARLIGGMRDLDGRVTLPGFYDDVRELSDDEREQLARLPMKDDFYKAQTGATELFGEKGYTPVEHASARPTLDVNGLLSGFTGEGSKTVLPAKAMAKVSCRLVPDQEPNKIRASLEQYLKDNVRPGISWELIEHAGGPPSITPRDSAGVRALADGMRAVWNTEPLYRREGGSIPVVAQMQEILGIDSVLTGFGLPDDNLHAPNEKLSLKPWYQGIDTLINFFYNLG